MLRNVILCTPRDSILIIFTSLPPSLHFHSLTAGRRDRKYNKFVVSPDNKLLAFLGKDGYILLVSNKVHVHTCMCAIV